MLQSRLKTYKIGIKEITIWLYALYGIRAIWLAFNSMKYSPIFYFANKLIGYMCIPAGLFLLIIQSKHKVKQENFIIILLPATYWIICVLNTYGGWKIGNGLVTLIQISIFLLFNKDIKAGVFDKFYKIFQICNIISLFVWGCYQLKIPIGIQTVEFYRGDFAVYKKWLIFALYHENSYSTILMDRLCGIFNEPGALGTICALLFIATFKYTKKREKALLLVTGALTYSVAFFALVVGYLVIYLFLKDIHSIIVAIAIIILFLQIPNINFGNEALNRLAARLKISTSGFAGDNRLTDSYSANYEAMKQTNRIFWGYGKGFSFSEGTLSYVTYIVQFGYIGFVLMIFQWLVASFSKVRNKAQLLYILFFFISLYQRPNPILSILGYILVFGGLAWMQSAQDTECKSL